MQPDSDTTVPAPSADTGPQRLPCRGCMSDCPNYLACEGSPWRQADRDVDKP